MSILRLCDNAEGEIELLKLLSLKMVEAGMSTLVTTNWQSANDGEMRVSVYS